MEIIIIGIVILIAGAVFIFCLTKLGGHSDSGASGEKAEKKSSGEKKAPKDKSPKDKALKDKPPRDIPVKEPPIKPDSAPAPKDAPRDLPDPEPGADTVSFFKAEYKPKHIWICSCCGVENAHEQTVCEVCGTERTKA